MSNIAITDQEFWQIVNLLKDRYGINLSQKKNLIVGRMQSHLRHSNFRSFSEFYDYVIADRTGEAVTLLLNKLTTNYTFFMRETEHFDFFRGTVLPYIINSEKDKDMRIWSAGCSSGEEPYSIAMCIADFFAGSGISRAAELNRNPAKLIAPPNHDAPPTVDSAAQLQNKTDRQGWDSRVLATDISERVLELASEGIYMEESMERLPPAWKNAFFTSIGAESVQVVERLRKEVIYRKFNLMEEHFPFRKRFHLIWCRNVMIYFDSETKKKLVEKFYDCTEPGGYLFIGHSESISRNETRYKFVMPAIYRRSA